MSLSLVWLVLTALPYWHTVHGAVNGDLRIVDGPSANEGRIEVYYDEQWGTICDDSWSNVDADVICKQLGYEGREFVRYRARYGQGTGPIWIDQVSCRSDDQSIMDCKHNGWGIHDCKHSEDAGVKCRRKVAKKPSILPVGLSCPSNSTCGSCSTCPDKSFPGPEDCLPQNAAEGIVEVFYNNVWRPLSADSWDLKSANVVCGQLGYPLAMAIPPLDELWCNWNKFECVGSASLFEVDNGCNSDTEFRNRFNSTWIKNLECLGSEARLLECYFSEFGPIASPSGNVATVRCGYNPHPNCELTNKSAEVYRTRGSAVPWKGRAEVRVKGEWGTICEREWDLLDGSVFCRGLGYGTAKHVTFRANYGRGAGKIHYAYLKCKGSERALSQCGGRVGRAAQAFGHGADAGVICNIPERVESCGEFKKSRIVLQRETNGFTSNFAEVYKEDEGWGLMCYEAIKRNSALVICRESSEQFAFRFRNGTHPDYRRKRYTWLLDCNGDEESVSDCKENLIRVSKCRNGESIIDCSANLPDLVPDVKKFEESIRYYPYIDRFPLYYLTCAHEEGCLSSSADGQSYSHNRALLRFSSQTMNYGTEDFRPLLNREKWIFHTCHNHYHSFEAFIHYDLLDPVTRKKVAEGHKASFCLEDSICDGASPRFRCSSGHQGISKNCGDLYARHLDCQWIDVTDIPPGSYILRQSVNPDRLMEESDYRNNVEECTLTIFPGFYFQVHSNSCKLSDH